MGLVGDYLGTVIGAHIETANKVLDLGSQLSATRSTVTKIRSGIHEFEKLCTDQPRYPGTNGGDIYTWFHEGPDPQSKDLQNAVKSWNKVSEHHKEASASLNSAMSKIKANWQGQAAEGAAQNAEPLRQSADTAHEHAEQAASTLQAQADGFHDTKNRVVKMEHEPPVISIKEQFTGHDTFDQRVNQYTAGQHANQQAYSGYGNTTQTNVQAVPNFQPAPDKPAQPGQDAQPVPGVNAQSSHLGSGSAHPASTSSSSMDSASSGGPGSSGAAPHPSQPSANQPGHNNPNSPAPNQPSFHYQRPGNNEQQSQQPDRGGTGAGIAAGAAGAAAGGGAIAGGSLLGGSAGARGAGISGRGLGQEPGGSSGSGGRAAPGPGGQSGSGGSTGSGSSGGAAATGAAGGARGGMAGGMGAAPPGGAGRKDDAEHERPDYLTEANPHAVFGLDERVAPPVFGDQNPPNGGE